MLAIIQIALKSKTSLRRVEAGSFRVERRWLHREIYTGQGPSTRQRERERERKRKALVQEYVALLSRRGSCSYPKTLDGALALALALAAALCDFYTHTPPRSLLSSKT